MHIVTVFEDYRRARFASFRFPNLHILHFRCFIPCLAGLSQERNLTVMILDVFISVQIYPFRFVPLRFAKYSKPFAKYRFSNLHILHYRCRIPCLGYRTKGTDLFISFRFVSQNTVSPSKSSFRKIPIFEFAYSALLV